MNATRQAQPKSIRRRSSGAGIIGSVAVLFVLILVIVGGTAMLMASGVASYYQGKVSLVAEQVAWREASRHTWYGYALNKDSQSDAQSTAQRLLGKMGLPSGNVQISSGVNQANSMDCSLSVDGLVMPSQANLPGAISMSAERQIPLTENAPGVLQLYSLNQPNNSVWIPCYNWFEWGYSDGVSLPLPAPQDVDMERLWLNPYPTWGVWAPPKKGAGAPMCVFQEDGVDIPQY